MLLYILRDDLFMEIWHSLHCTGISQIVAYAVSQRLFINGHTVSGSQKESC